MHANLSTGQPGVAMLTRAKARATNQHVFVDDKWNDAYIQTKDEQIEMLHAQRVLKSWEDDEDSEAEGDEDEDEDRWVSEEDDSDQEEGGGAQGKEEENTPCKRRRGGNALASGGFVENVVWTFAAAAVVPVVVYGLAWQFLPFLRRPKRSHSWPLQSGSYYGTLFKAYTNVLTISILLAVAIWAVCGDLGLPIVLPSLRWRLISRRLRRLDACTLRFIDDWTHVLSANVSALMVSPRQLQLLLSKSLVLAAVASMLMQFHRLWLKSVVLFVTASMVIVRFAYQLRVEQRSAIEITSLDPNFAFANETIFVAIDGQNLEQGATVAWIPYWGVLQHLKAFECEKLFAQPLRNGGVRVAFDQLNEFVPCYAARDQDDDFKCFEDLKLRVKDQKSVPGWSLYAIEPPKVREEL